MKSLLMAAVVAGTLSPRTAPPSPKRLALAGVIARMLPAAGGRAGCQGVAVGGSPAELECFTQERVAPGFPGVRQVIRARVSLAATAFRLPPPTSAPTVALVYRAPGGRDEPVTYAELDRALQTALRSSR